MLSLTGVSREVSPLCLGLGLSWTWSALMAPTFGHADIIGAAASLALLASWRLFEVDARRRAVVWVVSIATSLAVAMLPVAESASLPVVASLALGFLASFGTLAMTLMWMRPFASMTMRSASIGMGLAFVAGSALYLAASALPGMMGMGVAAVLPILSASLLHLRMLELDWPQAAGAAASRGARDDGASSGSCVAGPAARVRFPFPWKIVLVVSLFCMASGINRVYSSTEVDMVAMGVAGVAIALVVLAFSARSSMYRIYRVFVPLMMATLLPGMILGKESLVSQMSVNVGFAFSSAMLMLYLCDQSRRFGDSVVRLYAAGKACVRLAMLAGSLADMALSLASGRLAGGYVAGSYALVVLAVGVAMALWLTDADYTREYGEAEDGAHDGEALQRGVGPWARGTKGARGADEAACVRRGPEAARMSPADDGLPVDERGGRSAEKMMGEIIRTRCEELASEYHLSPREREVLVILAWGKSARRVEEILGVSSSTVKTHMRHIYTKMGIHSRAELDALLNIEGGMLKG